MNKIIIVGNLARDPELRTTGSGISVCQFSVAVTRKYSNANGEKETDFIPVVAWRQLGELCAKYLAKGRKACVFGSLQIRSYEDKQGQKRTIAEVVADDVEFMSPKDSQGSGGYHTPPPNDAPPTYSNFSEGADETTGFTELDDAQLPF